MKKTLDYLQTCPECKGPLISLGEWYGSAGPSGDYKCEKDGMITRRGKGVYVRRKSQFTINEQNMIIKVGEIE